MIHVLSLIAIGWGSAGTGSGFEVKDPITYANLTIFPVFSSTVVPKLESRYITLDEGMKQKLIVVKEMGDEEDVRPIQRQRPGSGGSRQNINFQSSQQMSGAEVNRLKLINKSKKMLLLIAGEMVVGGKQDRIVQKDSLILPDSAGTALSVFCVEQGRWHGGDANFGSAAGGYGGNVANPSVRGTAQAKADQGAVWSGVARTNSKLGTNTDSQTLRETIVSKKVQGNLSAYIKAIESKLPDGACGVVVAIDGKLVWMDLFPTVPTLFEKYWPKLLRSYALDALATDAKLSGKIKSVTVKEALAFLEDRSGKSSFEGEEKVFKLRRTESDVHVIYDIEDLGPKPDVLLHTCKMLKK